jgi:hypothetical protein
VTKHYCDACNKQVYDDREGYWRLSHTDAKPGEYAAIMCWECYGKTFPMQMVGRPRKEA